MIYSKPPKPETVAGVNVTATIFLLLLAVGVAGGLLATGIYEPPFKITLFFLGAFGTTSSFLGTRAFHHRRVEATGDPRTTVYSALTIYSMLFFSVMFYSLALVLVGREYGFISPDLANFVAYFFITDVVLLLFLLGCACLWDMTRPGLLARRIYLWPWSYIVASLVKGEAVGEPGGHPDMEPGTRNDADRNEENYDRETDQGETPEEDRT